MLALRTVTYCTENEETPGCALWYLDLRFADWGWRERHPHVADWYATYGQRPEMTATWSLD